MKIDFFPVFVFNWYSNYFYFNIKFFALFKEVELAAREESLKLKEAQLQKEQEEKDLLKGAGEEKVEEELSKEAVKEAEKVISEDLATGSETVKEFSKAVEELNFKETKAAPVAGKPGLRRQAKFTRDGILWVVAIVKSFVNKQAGSWLLTQEWTTNQKPGQQVDPTLDNDYNS